MNDLGSLQEQWEALVVGAGPAGSMTAYQLARAGVEVLLVERAVFPRHKVCGCCLNQAGANILRNLANGTLLESVGAKPLSRLRLHCGGRRAEVKLPGGCAVSRRRLDSALSKEAQSEGAIFLDGCHARLKGRTQSRSQIQLTQKSQAKRIEARVVVCADGLNGDTLRGQIRLKPQIRPNSRIGVSAIVAQEDIRFPQTIVMSVAGSGYAGMVELEDGSLNVAAALDRGALADSGGQTGRAVGKIIREAGLDPPGALQNADWKGTAPLTRRRNLAEKGIFVLGDSAGYVEPFTGEGMTWALVCGKMVVPFVLQALEAWHPALEESWGKAYHKALARRQRLCHWISQVLRRPSIFQILVRILGSKPHWAEPFVLDINRPILGERQAK